MKRLLPVIILSYILYLSSCTGDKAKVVIDEPAPSVTVADADSTSADITLFHSLHAEGIIKLVVFLRDTLSVSIDGKTVDCSDSRVSLDDGMLRIAAVDSLPEHRIHEVRVYVPNLEYYRIRHCGEANLSGDADVSGKFAIDIYDCNVFRDNVTIRADHVDIRLDRMLMASFKLHCSDLSLYANRLQHVEVKGRVDQRTLSGDSEDKIEFN